MIRITPLFLLATMASLSTATADDSRQVTEVEIDVGIDEVWQAFTTTAGLKSWVAPVADVDFKIGGKWRANYNPNGKLGDETTIENTILSFDPQRMISIRPTKFPKGFPFAEVAKTTWSVFYFSPISKSRTKVTVVGLGYTDDEQSQKMRAFFTQGNKYSLGQLKKALTKKDPQTKQ